LQFGTPSVPGAIPQRLSGISTVGIVRIASEAVTRAKAPGLRINKILGHEPAVDTAAIRLTFSYRTVF